MVFVLLSNLCDDCPCLYHIQTEWRERRVGAEQADEKLLCLSVCTTYYRLQDTELAKGGRKPKVLALLGVLTVERQQLFATQRSHQASFLSSYPS